MGGSPNCALLGSWTGQKHEKETEINTSSCSHRQVFFSLLYKHPNASAPNTTAKLKACCSARSQVAVDLSITLHFHPVVLMSFTTSSLLPLLFFHVRFSAQFIVQPLQHFYTQDIAMQRHEEIAGNVPASPVSALSIHTVAPPVTETSNYAAA